MNFKLLFVFAASLFLLTPSASAKYIGADPPKRSCACNCACAGPLSAESSNTSSAISRSEGNLMESLTLSGISSGVGGSLALTTTYNSYNADGSRDQVDTVMGYGWTHSYNMLLFDQLGAMFRYDGEGRVTRYALFTGGVYTTAKGYFETLVKNLDGSFTLTQKDKTAYRFEQVPGTPFLVGGPVWRLTRITDRNGNLTTLTYTAGNLTSITNAYGRSLTLAYNGQNKLISVTDPAGRVTTMQYDATGHRLAIVTDPNGRTVQYTYNTLNQLTRKTDKAGRVFTYSYQSNLPVAVKDGSGTSRATLSNPGNWATDATALAMSQTRVYVPSTTSNLDGRGNTLQYQYDSNGYLTKLIAPDASTVTYTYDSGTLMPASRTDANGHVTTSTYDAQGNVLSTTDHLGNTTSYTYEPVYNMVTSVTDARGRTTTYAYDASGNRTVETDPLLQTRSWTYDSHGNVLTETDKNSHTTTYQYDASGNRIKITDALANVTTMTYDNAGNLTSRTDPNGHTTTYQYDGLNRQTKEIDATGHATQSVYDGQGNVTQSIDRNGRSTTFQYDSRQRLIKRTDALGHSETYGYDGNDNRTSVTDRNGHTTTFQYDSQNRTTKVTDAIGGTTTSVYDPAGNLLSRTDANSHSTSYTYDALNRRVTMTDAAAAVTLYQYDTGTITGCPTCGATPGSSLITGQTDPNGKVTYFKYDALNRLIDTVRKVGSAADTITPSDAVTVTTYDAVGNKVSITQPNGNTTTYQYDALNRRPKETNAAGDVTTTAYDGAGNIISVTAPNLNVTTYTYDALDRLTQVNDSAGPYSTFTYDFEGNRLTQTDGNGSTTKYTYDAVYRLVTVTDPLNKSTTSQYDSAGNLLKTTDRNAHATTYIYDAINRRTSMTDALGNTTQYQYDAVGNLIQITDANGHATQYLYDAVDRPVKETYADTRTRQYAYDPAGNLISRTDQLGQVTTYSYSDLYFLTGRTYPTGPNDTFTYDLSGRMLSGQRGTWPVTFAYDGADRLTQTIQNGRTISYSYNIPGRTRSVTYPGGRTITEFTDARRRLDHVNDIASPPAIVQYVYDPGNRPTSRAYRNGTSATYSYNGNNWTLNLQHSLGVTPIAGFNYAYDNEGNRQYEKKLQDTTHSEAYQYDLTDRLISYKVGSLVGSTVPAPSTQTSYSLDPVGNWNSKTTDAVTQTRVHDVVNELVKIDATNLIYDFDGNLQNDGVYTYAYDVENRLTGNTRISDAALVGQYQYDALGRRVQKTANPAGSPSTTSYFYDDGRIIEEQAGVVTQATYVYGIYVDEPVTMDRAGQTYYYHQNALWSVEAVTDSAGTAVERYSYDAYGKVAVTTGVGAAVAPNAWGTPHSAIGNPWTFTGRQLDEEDGLYYYRARYYDAAKGRFLQRDPVEYRDGMNLYEYTTSKPTRLTDPTGLTVRADVEVKLGNIYKFDAYIEGEEYGCCEFFPNPRGKASGDGSVFHYTQAAGGKETVHHPKRAKCKNCCGDTQEVSCWQYDFAFTVVEAFYATFTIIGQDKLGVSIGVSATFQTARHDFSGSLVICADGYAFAKLDGENRESYRSNNVTYKFPFTGKSGRWDFNGQNDKESGSARWNSFKDETQVTKACRKECKNTDNK